MWGAMPRLCVGMLFSGSGNLNIRIMFTQSGERGAPETHPAE
jgi:hypothetical protein